MAWRQRRWVRRTLRTVLGLCAFVLLFSWIGDIGSLSIHRPFDYYGDSLEVLAMAHDRIANDYDTRLRAPFELSKPESWHYAYDAFFQSTSNLIWIAKALGRGDTAKTLNLAYLLTYLLAFLFAYWGCGRLGLRDPFRFGAASLFALMPYHFQRAENHFVESTYYFVPVMALVMIELWAARPLAFRWSGSRWQFTWGDGRIWFAVFLLAFLTPFNPYHQFFFACLVASAAPFAAAYRRNWRPLLVGWGLALFACAVLVLKGALAQHLSAPELALSMNNQPIGGYGGAEAFPLKLIQMLLPVQDHRWSAAAAFRHMYDAANPLNNENGTTTLGFVGAIGLLSCIALALVTDARLRTSRAGKMGLIVLMAVLFGSMGGFSSLVSTISVVVLGPHALLTQARGWDRIVIFIGFFAYFTAFWLLQRLATTFVPRVFAGWKQVTLVWVIGLAVFAFALWDQVPYKITQQHRGHYRSDVAFFGSLEKELPANARVFQVPFIIHHLSGWVQPGVYYTDQLRPYINTQTLHFTYGGDRGTAQTEWLRGASALQPDQAARYLCRYGFAGILIQRNMLKKPGLVEQQWHATLGESPEMSEDRDYSFFGLRAFCDTHQIPTLEMGPVKARVLQKLDRGKRFLSAGVFQHRIGRYGLSDGDIALVAGANEGGWLAYGPGESLKPGHYRAIFRFSSTSNGGQGGSLTMDVVAQGHSQTKQKVLNSVTFKPATGPHVNNRTLDFAVTQDESGLQYRVSKTQGFGVDFLGVEIQRISG